MKYIALIAFLFLSWLVKAQDIKRTAIWYFGENAGINFNTNPPTPLTDGKVNTIEGCASICDTAGNLLFYTDGRTVWNKNHDTMINGFGLMGHESATQGALIVPKPESDSIYYIFTIAVHYTVSEVNINANNGKGEVTIKNNLLVTPVGEKQTAVQHANGIDYWVITHGGKNDLFYAFLVTKYGISECPITSKIGTNYSIDYPHLNPGSMKANFKGDKIAVCLYIAQRVELFDFDNGNGTVKNIKRLQTTGLTFGLEFSSSNNHLYVVDRDKVLLQYDLTSNDETSINSSRKIIHNFPPDIAYKLQIGLDNRIYVANSGKQKIGVINKPNLNDTFCEFRINSFNLSPKQSLYGLPDFVTSFFNQPSINFKYIIDCKTNGGVFIGYDTINGTLYKWYFSKGNKKDSLIGKNPSYLFTDTGNYAVTFIASNSNRSDTVTKEIFIHPAYTLDLGQDTTICSTPFILEAGEGQFCYIWQDSSSNPAFEVNSTGTYSVKVVTQNFCTQFDTINVVVATAPLKPTITRNKDTLFSTAAANYQWYYNNSPINGAAQKKHILTANGIYKVEITDSNGCTAISDTINIINLGYSKVQASKMFSIYPNSTKDKVYITKPFGVGNYGVEIIDLQGRKYLTRQQLTGNTEEVDLQAIAAGVYLVNIIINNQIIETQKLIKI
ncbi:MAG TPA: T9SS type A sorting domain-containing protein [Bacteroidia bacterium]|nr:T9SS type A sorting domain-containing protein [Bacteroidia bacterium]